MLKKFLPVLAIIISFVSCSFAYSGGTGSQDDPYVISTESELLEFRNNVNSDSDSGSYYVLSTDAVGFQMTKYNTWTPVGNTNSFTGHLEGNDKIIYVNMSNNTSKDRVAFFGTIGSGATVSNLSIEGSVKSNTDAAGFALTLDGGTLTNCRFSGQIYVNDSVPDDTTENLNAAGLVEYMSSGTIEDCIFNGEIKIDGGIYPRAGGIVALMHGGSIKDCDVSHYSIIESYATEVEVVDENDVVIPPSAIAGGIAGQVNIGLSETIEGCDFSGKVTAESWNTSYAGGIVGYMRGGTLKDNTLLDDSVISGKYTAGGIVGFLRTGGTVENNTVEAGATITAESNSAGGIIGILDLGTVTNNESHATISGNASYKGGIIGLVTPATESPATRTITGNSYSGADYGIGSDSSGSPSNEGTDETESPFYITTSSALTSGVVYETYSQVFATSVSSDSASWQRTSGEFPSGLTLSGNTLSGTPTETGTFEFTLTASVYNSVNNSYRTAEKTFSLTIDAHLNITTSSALENGTAGRTYGPVTFETDAEDGAYVTWTASGLPAGLTLGNLTGILTGTPTTAGYYSFTVTAQSGAYTATKTFTITINPSLTITTDSELPSALVNSAYSVTLSSSASDSENVIWSRISGTLPTGLTLSNSGIISGTPTASGTFNFVIQASIENTSYTDSQDFEITVMPVITITTSSLDSGKAGSSYSQTLAASPSGLSYTWSVLSGDFPSDLTLDSSSGTITGTPSSAGTYTFTVRALSGSLYGDKIFTLTINSAFSIITESSDLGYAKMNEYYSFDLKTDAEDSSSVIWSLTGGSLPPGMYLASYTGRIYGTPTTAGYYAFTVSAVSGALTAEKTLALIVRPSLSITTSSPLPAGVINQVYSQDIQTDAEAGNIVTWSLVSGDLPNGITFNTSTGRLYGTPSSAGTYAFTIGAKSGSYTAENKTFTLTMLPSLSITTSALTNAKVSRSYSEDISAASISGQTYTWSLLSGDLPAGLTLSSSTTSTITLSGTPTTEGTYTFTLQVSAAGMTANQTFTLTVEPLMTITTASLPDGKMNRSYSASLTTEVESSAFVIWSVVGGALPEGLTLGSYTGAITGTPTRAGYFVFTVRASAGSLYAEKELGIIITPSLSITTSSPLPEGIINRQYSQTLSCDSEAGNVVTWTHTGGSLPDGLTFNSSTGIISGIPSESGTFTFTIRASAGSLSVSKEFSLTIMPELYIITDSILPSVKVLHDYSVTLSASSIAENVFTWSLVSSDLPSGLTLNASTGTISGIPTTEGTYRFTVQAAANGQTAGKEFTLEVRPSLYITTTSPLPAVKEGSRYEVQLSTDIDSDMMITWSVISGDLPNGLTLRENTGVISGIPDTEGTYVFIIHAKAGLLESSKTFTLTVKPALSITTGSELPEARPNELYLLKFETDADSFDVVEWQFISGDLPEGFTFRKETGILSGSSSQNGVYEFTIGADVRTSSRNLSARKIFVLRLSPAMIITNNNSYTANAGSSFSLKLETLIPDTASKESSVWSVISGDIPLGLKLNEDGTLSGIPTRAGTFRFTLQALSGYSRARKDFTFRINLAISSPSYLTDGIKGESYSELLKAEGSSNITWSLVKGNTLPSGLTLSEAGLIQGIPTTEGIYDFTVNASDDNGNGARKLLRITIGSSALIPITTSSLTSGTAGEAYYAVLYSSVSNVKWEITEGFLPAGLTLNSSNGVIEGTPLEPGTFTFTVQASYDSRRGTRQFTLIIYPAEELPDEPKTISSSGGGGCNTGLNSIMLLVSLSLICRRRN